MAPGSLAAGPSGISLTGAVNELNRSMGEPDLYPFLVPAPATVKLRFVHRVLAEQGPKGSLLGRREVRGTKVPAKRPKPKATLAGAEWWAPWIMTCEIAWTAPLVIAARLTRMMWGGWPPNARDRREYTRMSQEKIEAFSEAMMAAAMAGPMVGAAAVERTLSPSAARFEPIIGD